MFQVKKRDNKTADKRQIRQPTKTKAWLSSCSESSAGGFPLQQLSPLFLQTAVSRSTPSCEHCFFASKTWQYSTISRSRLSADCSRPMYLQTYTLILGFFFLRYQG